MKRKFRYNGYNVNKKEVEREYNYIPFRYILDTFEKSIKVTPDMLRTNLIQRFIRAVVRIFAPML